MNKYEKSHIPEKTLPVKNKLLVLKGARDRKVGAFN